MSIDEKYLKSKIKTIRTLVLLLEDNINNIDYKNEYLNICGCKETGSIRNLVPEINKLTNQLRKSLDNNNEE